MSLNNLSKNHKAYLALAILASLIFLGLLLHSYISQLLTIWQMGTDPKLLEGFFRPPNLYNMVLLICLTGLMTAIPFMSSSAIAVVNGVVLGPWLGFAMNWAGALLGNLLVLWVISHTDLSHHQARNDKHSRWLSHFQNHFLSLTLGYLIPFVPSFLVNDRALAWKMPRRQVVLAILLGTAPANLLYALGGDALFKWNLRDLAWVAGALLVCLVIYFAIKHFTGKKDTHVA